MLSSSHSQLETDKTRLVEYLTQHEEAVSQKSLREHLRLNGEQFSAALRDLLEQNRVSIFRLPATNELMISLSTKGLSDNFARVLQEVRRCGSSGIDQATLADVLRMPRTEIAKALRALVSQRYIQEWRSFTNKAKKVYLLFHLEPSTQVTGGALYCGEELDVSLVDSLRSLIASFVYRKKVASLSEIQQFMESLMTHSPSTPSFPPHAPFSTTAASGSPSPQASPVASTPKRGASSPSFLADSTSPSPTPLALSPALLASAAAPTTTSLSSHRSDLHEICTSPISIVASPSDSPASVVRRGAGGDGQRPPTSSSSSFPSSPAAPTLMSLREYQEHRQSAFLSSAANALTSKHITPREVWILIRTLVLDGVLDERYTGSTSIGSHLSSSSSFAFEAEKDEVGNGGEGKGMDWELYLAPRQPHTGVVQRPPSSGGRWMYSMAVGKNVLRHFSAVPHVPLPSRPPFFPLTSSSSLPPPTLVALEEAAAGGVSRKRARLPDETPVKIEMIDEGIARREANRMLTNVPPHAAAGADGLAEGEVALSSPRQWLHHLLWRAFPPREGMMPSPLTESWAAMKHLAEEREDMVDANAVRGDALAGGGNGTDLAPHRCSTSEQEGEESEGEVYNGRGEELEWYYMAAVGYPCLGCPLLSSCNEGSVVNPTDCVYLHEWMK